MIFPVSVLNRSAFYLTFFFFGLGVGWDVQICASVLLLFQIRLLTNLGDPKIAIFLCIEWAPCVRKLVVWCALFSLVTLASFLQMRCTTSFILLIFEGLVPFFGFFNSSQVLEFTCWILSITACNSMDSNLFHLSIPVSSLQLLIAYCILFIWSYSF